MGSTSSANDLAEHSIIADPDTLKLNAIIGWEHARFLPSFFKAPVYTRHNPRAKTTSNDPENLALILEVLRSAELLMVGEDKGRFEKRYT